MAADARWADSVYYADLVCRQCGENELHELRYAGRRLATSRCMNCGAVIKHDDADLRKAYLKDLEGRLRTKPSRMAKRAARHPAKFVTHLPNAILKKPARLIEEARSLMAGLLGAHGR